MDFSKLNISSEELNIAIVGLGYVGLPLGIEFSKKYNTIGFDNNNNRIEELISGLDKTMEISDKELKSSNLKYTSDLQKIKNCNLYIVTVPTPVDKYNNPDMRFLKSANISIGKVLKKNDMVIYESTIFPGATEEFSIPILENQSGLKCNKDFSCGYSPERINPGDKEHSLKTIKKITSGSNEKASDLIDQLYSSIIPAGTYKVSSIAVAEAAKVIENIQRDVNIALINELSMIFHKLDLDTNEILQAAETKWNFLPFKPGLVGGHCIGVDPYYLTYKCIELNFNPEMILAGRRINDGMGKYISNSTIIEMTKAGISPVGSKVAIFGITFKENCPDIRNTKVPDIISNLINFGCQVVIADPYADAILVKEKFNINLISLDQINDVDAIILAVAHDQYKMISKDVFKKMLKKDKGVFMDVKSTYAKNYFLNLDITHWRL